MYGVSSRLRRAFGSFRQAAESHHSLALQHRNPFNHASAAALGLAAFSVTQSININMQEVVYTKDLEEEDKHYDANGFKHVVIGGIVQPWFFKKDKVEELQQDFVLRDSDIVIASFPKCGTTWMQQILLTLQFDGDKSKVKRCMEQVPWLEVKVSSGTPVQELIDWDGSTNIGPTPPRRVWKTHAPVELAPWKGGTEGLEKAKVVVVTRNPKDACVSYFHHSKDLAVIEYFGDFQHFTSDLFLRGNVHCGCFWSWHAGWQRAADKDKSHIIWVSYEELKQDPVGTISKLADFLNIPASKEVIARTVGASSFAEMKQTFAEEDAITLMKGGQVKKNHIRKGEMGSWRADIDGALLVEFDAVHTCKCSEHGLTYKFNFG